MFLENTPIKTVRYITDTESLPASECFRLLMVLCGRAAIQWGSQHFICRDNDLLLTEPSMCCQLTVSAASKVLLLEIRPSMLTPGQAVENGKINSFPKQTYMCNSIKYPDLDFDPLRRLITAIAGIYAKNEAFGYHQLTALAHQLVYLLIRNYAAANLQDSDKYTRRMEVISEYIECNYNQSITLEGLAEYLHLTPPYLSRFFKDRYKMTFNRYVNQLRFSRAVDDLKNTQASITDIVHKHGFPNMSAFTSMFKKIYGTTPGDFRRCGNNDSTKTHSTQTPTELYAPVSSEKTMELDDCLCNYSTDATTPYPAIHTSYTIDMMKDARPVAPFWNKMITAGTLSAIAHPHTSLQLATMARNMGFTYASVMQLFDPKELYYDRDFQRYNFLAFDNAINILHMNHLIPYLELNFSAEMLREYGLETDEKQYMHWLEALLNHCQRLYNPAHVHQWMFDIGFNQDLHDLRHESVADFIRRFSNAFKLIRRTFPQAKIGGIGFFTAEPMNLLEKILDGLSIQGITPDFISLTCYPYKRTEDGLVYAADARGLISKIKHVKSALRQHHMKKTDVLISHFSPDHLHRYFLNDMCYQAAFITHMSMAMAGHIDFVGYDQISDAADGVRSTHFADGRSGFFTDDNLPKPGYFAMDFLSHMGNAILEQKDGLLVTRGIGGNYTILLDNYIAPDAYYCQNTHLVIRPKNAYSVYEAPVMRNVTLSLKLPPKSSYKTITYRLNKEHGSIFDIWQKMGYWEDAIRSDIEYFRQTNQPLREYRLLQVENGNICLHLALEPHEVMLIELFP